MPTSALWPTYVRFVCFELVEGQRSRLGLFGAMDLAHDSDLAVGWAVIEIESIGDWFNDNLKVPPHYKRGTPRCLSWFKDTAHAHIEKMYVLKTALETCGVHVDVLTTRDPGKIVYEDEHQITALARGLVF